VPPKYSAANIPRGRGPVFRYLERFEEIISRALLLMMAAVVLLTTIELGYYLVKRAGREGGGNDSKHDAAIAAPEDAAQPG
jgi:hypothetical protein